MKENQYLSLIQRFLNTTSTSLQSNNNTNNQIKLKTTPQIISKFVNKYKLYLEMIPIYSYFFKKTLKTIKKLNLYFHIPYFYQNFNMKLIFDNSHFLIWAKEIESLKKANFSFNSLVDKSFQYIIGIIDKSTNLYSLKLPIFTPDINYFDYSLFNLISSKKISLTKLFQEQRDFEIKYNQNHGKKNEFIYTKWKIINYIYNKFKQLFQFTKNKNFN